MTTVGTTITVTGNCADFDSAAAAAALAADLGVSVSQITVTTSCDDGRRRRLDGSFTVDFEIVVDTTGGADDPAVSVIVSALDQTSVTAAVTAAAADAGADFTVTSVSAPAAVTKVAEAPSPPPPTPPPPTPPPPSASPSLPPPSSQTHFRRRHHRLRLRRRHLHRRLRRHPRCRLCLRRRPVAASVASTAHAALTSDNVDPRTTALGAGTGEVVLSTDGATSAAASGVAAGAASVAAGCIDDQPKLAAAAAAASAAAPRVDPTQLSRDATAASDGRWPSPRCSPRSPPPTPSARAASRVARACGVAVHGPRWRRSCAAPAAAKGSER